MDITKNKTTMDIIDNLVEFIANRNIPDSFSNLEIYNVWTKETGIVVSDEKDVVRCLNVIKEKNIIKNKAKQFSALLREERKGQWYVQKNITSVKKCER